MSDGLTKLALMHDSEDMIGLTRSFVNDIRTGFSMLNNGLIPWLDEVSKQPWKGVLCLGMGGSAAGVIFFHLFVIGMVAFQSELQEDMNYQTGGMNIGLSSQPRIQETLREL